MIETIAIGLGAAKSAIDIVKSIRESGGKLEAAELKARMADIYSALADVKMALSDAESLIAEKEKELQERKQTLNVFEESVEVHGMKYRADENGAPIGSPYCPVCSIDDGIAILTHRDGVATVCPRCKSNFPRVARYQDP